MVSTVLVILIRRIPRELIIFALQEQSNIEKRKLYLFYNLLWNHLLFKVTIYTVEKMYLKIRTCTCLFFLNNFDLKKTLMSFDMIFLLQRLISYDMSFFENNYK